MELRESISCNVTVIQRLIGLVLLTTLEKRSMNELKKVGRVIKTIIIFYLQGKVRIQQELLDVQRFPKHGCTLEP